MCTLTPVKTCKPRQVETPRKVCQTVFDLYEDVVVTEKCRELVTTTCTQTTQTATHTSAVVDTSTNLVQAGVPKPPVRRRREAEAEADPALVYSTGLVGAYPYAVGAHAVTYAGAPHAVAHTPFGVTHSSNVGICTNVKGAVVPCRRKREADPALVYSTVGAVPYTYGVLPYAGVHGTNPVHAVAHTAAGLTHSSNVGICTNYVGAVVPC